MGKRKFQIIALATLVVLLAAFAWLALTARPTLYEGKPLTEWVDEYTVCYLTNDYNKIFQFDRKIHWFGPSAVPQLMDMMEAKHPWKEKLYEFVFRRNLTNQWATDLKRKAYIESYRPSSAAYFLYKIGPAAEPAIPVLIRAAASTNRDLCADAINALGAIHQQPDLVVPVLIRALSNQSWDGIFASGALWHFGTNAVAAVPGLRDFATNASPMYRMQAIESLRRIAPDSNLDLIVPFYIKILETNDSQNTYSAIVSLTELGPRAKDAVPALLKVFSKGDYNGQAAAYALKAIDLETAAKVWPTFPRSASFNLSFLARQPESREEFVARVHAMGAQAMPYLTNLLASKSTSGPDASKRQYAAYMLGEMGPAARSVVPALRRAAADSQDFAYIAAQAALMKIEGKPLAPVIEQLRDTSDPLAWNEKAALVAEFGTNAEAAIPAIIAAINSAKDTDRFIILPISAKALGQIHRRPDLCVPVLISLLDSPRFDMRQDALDALLAFGTDAKPALPKAIEAMNDLDSSVRSQAAKLVKQLDPGGKAAAK